MRRKANLGVALVAAAVLLGGAALEASAQQRAGQTGRLPVDRLVVQDFDRLDWRPAPNALPPGADVAVALGDPMTGPYVIYMFMPEGYQIPAHYHSDAEKVTVIKGEPLIGSAEGQLAEYEVGDFIALPARMPHRAECRTKGGCIVMISRDSALDITYLNPQDDPRRARGGTTPGTSPERTR